MKPLKMLGLGTVMGLLLGLVCGRILQDRASFPFGRRPVERRQLTADLRLDEVLLHRWARGDAGTVLARGTTLDIDWHEGNAAYISFTTLVQYDRLAAVSEQSPLDDRIRY